jgi:hypothetical protein
MQHRWAPDGMSLPHVGNAGTSRLTDRSRNRPQRWSQRYEIILHRYLAGWRSIEIAAELRYSPRCQVRKTALLQDLTGDARGAFLDEIRREAVPNFEFLRTVRDDATLTPRIRLRAVQAIADQLDRLLPRDGE